MVKYMPELEQRFSDAKTNCEIDYLGIATDTSAGVMLTGEIGQRLELAIDPESNDRAAGYRTAWPAKGGDL